MRKLILILILLLLGFIGWYISTGYFSSGERAGTISKLSERGYIFKTNEGVLNEGGYSGETGTLTPRYWDFSAKEDSVVEKLKMALSTGERITLHYQEKFLKFPWNGDTKYFITDVTFLPKPQPVQTVIPAVQEIQAVAPVDSSAVK
ncbi:MAG: hypothetical protein U0V04_13795 [Spirosomataceae bacterium]